MTESSPAHDITEGPPGPRFEGDRRIGAQELRIVTLKPSDHFETQLEVELEILLRKDAKEYEALSYCCGDPTPTEDAIVNGIKLGISGNLASALRYLREKEIVRHLWVDAISIRQEDKKEKNSQVQDMNLTYSRASKVVVWLGPPSEEDRSRLAMKAINSIGFQYQGKTLQEIYDQKLELPSQIDGEKGESGPSVYLPSITKLLQRDYFARLWVVQEVCLAPADTVTIICGYDKADFWHLANMQLAVVDPKNLILKEEDKNKTVGLENIGVFLSMTARLQEPPLLFTRQLFAVSEEEMSNAGGLSNEALQAQESTLLRHLWTFRNRKCGDPRDKIYAIRSLASDIMNDEELKPLLDPDYVGSVDKAYTKAACAIIKKHKKLDVLGLCLVLEGAMPGGKSRPSWAPNLDPQAALQPFTPLTWYHGEAREGKPYYHASRDSAAEPVIPGDMSHLKVDGYDLGTINAIAIDKSMPWLDGVKRSWELAKNLPSTGRNPYENIEEGFWRTLITDRTSTNKTARSDFEGKQFPLWWQVIIGERAVDLTLYPDYHKAFLQHWVARSFFTMDSGYIGLGPAATKANDHVVLLAGAQVAFVLREYGGQYQVIGEAYVHGVMYGECWQKLEEKNVTRAKFALI